MAKSKLGRGMENLFDDNSIDTSNQVVYISIDSISPKKNQPRKFFDSEALSELASSIAAHGIIQPVIVRESAGETPYEIIAGERRYRASKLAGLSEIPCIVRDADEMMASQLALIENIQRENLNPYEEAKAYKALIDDFGLSQEEMAKQVGKSRPSITNSMRLLELPDSVAQMLISGKLSGGHCRTLLGLKDRSMIEEAAAKIYKKNLSVRETEVLVKRLNSETEEEKEEAGESKVSVNYYQELERRVTGLIGRRVRISNGRNKKVVQIEYNGNEDLEELLSRICGESIIEKE